MRWLFSRRLECKSSSDPLLPTGEKAMRDPGLEAELEAAGCKATTAVAIATELGKASSPWWEGSIGTIRAWLP